MAVHLASNPGNPQQRAGAILASVALERHHVYRWLALSFYPPVPEVVSALNDGQFGEELRTSTGWLGNDQSILLKTLEGITARQRRSLAELDADYIQLFCRGLDKVPPYESAYRWRDASQLEEVPTDVRQSLRHLYNQYGLTPLDYREDHAAVELEFLAYLCEQEAGHWANGSLIAARELRRQERIFLTDHLGRWFPEFASRIIERREGSFYACLARWCSQWLSLDHGPGYAQFQDNGQQS